MEESIVSILYLGPRFRMDIRKFSYLMKVYEPESAKKPIKEDFLKLCTKGKFQIGKKTGTQHFHEETLRHGSGEFSLNRIFSSGGEKSGTRHISLRKGMKKTMKKEYDSGCKKLIERTQQVLSLNERKKKVTIREMIGTQNSSILRGKSRKYLSLTYVC